VSTIRGFNRFDAKYTIKDLELLNKELTDIINKSGDFEELVSETSITDNKIHIYITKGKERLEEEISKHFNIEDFKIYVVESTSIENTSRTTSYDPLWGGLRINNTTASSMCTSAFSAYDSNGNYYYVSAGHCGSVGDTFSQGGVIIGNVSDSVDASGVDALLIPISSSKASTKIYDNDAYQNYVVAGGWMRGDDVVGEPVCVSGATSDDVDCGTFEGYTLGYARSSITSIQGGDSGAPVYNPDYMTSFSYVKGVTKGLRSFDNKHIYSQVSNVLKHFNLEGVVSE
jgi:hypothetical protein